MLPQVLFFVATVLSDLATGRHLAVVRLFLDVLTVVFEVIVAGTYPSMVQAALQGQKFSVGEAISKSVKKFWTLLLALAIVVVLVVIGLIAVLVPGVIFLCWYVYTIPSIMLENKGPLDGMAASKAFGRDKKTSTFGIMIVAVFGGLVIEVIEALVAVVSPFPAHVVAAVLEIPLMAWASTVFTYVYIAYGPSATPGAPTSPGQAPPTSTLAPPPEQAVPGTGKHFCPSCGAPIQENAKFCPSCGRPV